MTGLATRRALSRYAHRRDDLDAARGILIAAILGAAIWALVIVALWAWMA